MPYPAQMHSSISHVVQNSVRDSFQRYSGSHSVKQALAASLCMLRSKRTYLSTSLKNDKSQLELGVCVYRMQCLFTLRWFQSDFACFGVEINFSNFDLQKCRNSFGHNYFRYCLVVGPPITERALFFKLSIEVSMEVSGVKHSVPIANYDSLCDIINKFIRAVG